MIQVSLSTSFPEWRLERQTPRSAGVWGGCRFLINVPVPACDYWIVYDDLVEPQTRLCQPSNVILFTGEPDSIRRYDERFLAQFAMVLTCQDALHHRNAVRCQPASPWHVGRRIAATGSDFVLDYDALRAIDRLDKPRLASIVVSAKRFTAGHRKRLDFLARLRNRFGPRLDVFGRGIRDIEDKWEALREYKYHIVLENTSCRDYWTEKLADAFLAYCYPVYFGCTNIADYFDPNAMSVIDIEQPDAALALIDRVFASSVYERHAADIAAARRKVMDTYNVFAVIANLIESMHSKQAEKQVVSLKPSSAFASARRRIASLFSRSPS